MFSSVLRNIVCAQKLSSSARILCVRFLIMNTDLSHKLALITGSTTGIGFKVASELAKLGASIVLNGRNEERLNGAVERLRSAHPKTDIKGIATDLGTGIAQSLRCLQGHKDRKAAAPVCCGILWMHAQSYTGLHVNR